MSYPYKQTSKRHGRRIDEHRFLMEQHIGRRLERFEFVHHKNGDKRDNRIENIELVTPAQHALEHGQWKHPTHKQCIVCDAWFEPSPTKRGTKQTCSKECRYALAARTQSRPDAPRSKYRVGAYPSEVASRKSRPSS
jgi:predicted nucleic acid-binding Zn ribbon protein